MTVTMQEAQSKLNELAALADGGEEITMLRDHQPSIRLVSVPQSGENPQSRPLGQNLLGAVILDPDWAEPLSPGEAEEWGFDRTLSGGFAHPAASGPISSSPQ